MKLVNAKVWYSFFVVVLYFLFGILLLIKSLFWQEVPNISVALFSVVVFLYGIFRGYRGYKDYQLSKEEQHETE